MNPELHKHLEQKSFKRANRLIYYDGENIAYRCCDNCGTMWISLLEPNLISLKVIHNDMITADEIISSHFIKIEWFIKYTGES